MIALDNGFQEVVGMVADADEASRRLAGALGYDISYAGDLAAPLSAAWGADQGAKGREVLIVHRDMARGAIRLFSFGGEHPALMRDGAQPWDAGGIFDINMRPG